MREEEDFPLTRQNHHISQQCNLVSRHYPRYSEAAALSSSGVAAAYEDECPRRIDQHVWLRPGTASSRQHADQLGSLQLQLCCRSHPRESSRKAYTFNIWHVSEDLSTARSKARGPPQCSRFITRSATRPASTAARPCIYGV